jgi:hypothetical protein
MNEWMEFSAYLCAKFDWFDCFTRRLVRLNHAIVKYLSLDDEPGTKLEPR